MSLIKKVLDPFGTSSKIEKIAGYQKQEYPSFLDVTYSRHDSHRSTTSENSISSLPEAHASSLSPAVLNNGRYAPENWANPAQVHPSNLKGRVSKKMRQTRRMTSYPATGGISQTAL
jgi:hypothetical protein